MCQLIVKFTFFLTPSVSHFDNDNKNTSSLHFGFQLSLYAVHDCEVTIKCLRSILLCSLVLYSFRPMGDVKRYTYIKSKLNAAPCRKVLVFLQYSKLLVANTVVM